VFEVLFSNLPYLLQGAAVTAVFALTAVFSGTLLGIVLGVVSTLVPRPLSWLFIAYVFVIRGIPVLVLMFLGYYALPGLGLRVDVYYAVGGALVIYSAAFVTEITRGAIRNVPIGQVRAAKSLGMRRLAILLHVVLPLAMRSSIPPVLNNTVIMIKQSSYASIVGVWELTYAAREVVERTLAPFEIFPGVMVLYFMIAFPLALLAGHLEKRYRYEH
jgi:polar amino acid transport system permease protein